MPENVARVARVTEKWSEQPDLVEPVKQLCCTVSGLAQSLDDRLYVCDEDRDSLVHLGCRLCQSVGEAHCCQPDSSPDTECSLGFPPDWLQQAKYF